MKPRVIMPRGTMKLLNERNRSASVLVHQGQHRGIKSHYVTSVDGLLCVIYVIRDKHCQDFTTIKFDTGGGYDKWLMLLPLRPNAEKSTNG
jgi:hypothetical protein